MGMETFIRKEIKYKITDQQKALFLARMKAFLESDQYPESTIYSIYLDTDQFDLLRICQGKPDFRQKVRIRSYAPVDSRSGQVFLELKKKVGKTGFKTRSAFEAGQLEDFLACPQGFDQATGEMAALLSRWKLKPQFCLQAHRFSYAWRGIADLRITIDDAITFRQESCSLQASRNDQPLLEPGWNIMEIKCSHNLPLELVRTLFDLSITPVSFSKAGQVYARILERKPDDESTPVITAVPANPARLWTGDVWSPGVQSRF